MTRNRILDELYDVRAQILAEHGEDLGKYMRSELERLKSEGHPIAHIKQRSIRYANTAQPSQRVSEGSAPEYSERPR